MASLKKTYFLAPSWDLNPGDVKLGSVVATVRKPHKILSAASLPHMIDTEIASPPSSKNVRGIVKTGRDWAAGLFASFVHYVTLGVSANVVHDSSSDVEFACEEMETWWFSPSPTYITSAAADPEVSRHFKLSGHGTSVFMITGVKTARGITIATSDETASALQAQAGLNIPAMQTQIGPHAAYKPNKFVKIEGEVSGPIVFALQFEKLWLTRRGQLKSEGFTRGAVLGTGSADVELAVVNAGADLEEHEAFQLGVSLVAGVEDGSACRIVIPELTEA